MKTLQQIAAPVLVLVLAAGLVGTLPPRVAEASTSSAEQRFMQHINRERENHGLAPVQVNSGARSVARSWSATMSGQDRLYHNPDLAVHVNRSTDVRWSRLAENVGRTRLTVAGWSQLVDSLHAAFMNSSGHRRNVLGEYNQAGIGVTIAPDGTMWVTQVFLRADAPVVAQSRSWNGPSSAGVPIVGDWNGDGRATAGWFDNGRVYLRARHNSGAPDIAFSFGRAGDLPIVGDWNGDGRDTIGVIREGRWYLRFTNSGGVAHRTFVYGRLTRGDYALAGDWNGDGRDTIGIVREGQWHLRNQLAGGPADHVFVYGRVRRGDVPVVGDWNGDGRDTPAIIRDAEWHVRLRNAGGAADRVFNYGAGTDGPVAGDWNGNGRATPGVVRGNAWLLRDALNGGGASMSYRF
jgi:uncharacterized protein YkwD